MSDDRKDLLVETIPLYEPVMQEVIVGMLGAMHAEIAHLRGEILELRGEIKFISDEMGVRA